MATVKFRIRRDTAVNWATENPILGLGEPALETDTHKTKYGDGATAYNSLPYSVGAATAWGTITGTLSAQTDLITALNAKITKTGDAMTGALGFASSIDKASNATCNIGAEPSNFIRITGTTTITAFDNIAAGTARIVRFAGILTLTHNATSLILPGAANIVTAAGDTALLLSEGSGNWRCLWYQKAGLPPVDGIWQSWTPTVAGSTPAGSGFTYTIGAARYSKIGKIVTATLLITLTNLGTGPVASGRLTVTLPFTAANASTGFGTENALSGHMVQAGCSAGSNILTIKKYDATTVLLLNAQIRVTITFEAQ